MSNPVSPDNFPTPPNQSSVPALQKSGVSVPRGTPEEDFRNTTDPSVKRALAKLRDSGGALPKGSELEGELDTSMKQAAASLMHQGALSPEDSVDNPDGSTSKKTKSMGKVGDSINQPARDIGQHSSSPLAGIPPQTAAALAQTYVPYSLTSSSPLDPPIIKSSSASFMAEIGPIAPSESSHSLSKHDMSKSPGDPQKGDQTFQQGREFKPETPPNAPQRSSTAKVPPSPFSSLVEQGGNRENIQDQPILDQKPLQNSYPSSSTFSSRENPTSVPPSRSADSQGSSPASKSEYSPRPEPRAATRTSMPDSPSPGAGAASRTSMPGYPSPEAGAASRTSMPGYPSPEADAASRTSMPGYPSPEARTASRTSMPGYPSPEARTASRTSMPGYPSPEAGAASRSSWPEYPSPGAGTSSRSSIPNYPTAFSAFQEGASTSARTPSQDLPNPVPRQSSPPYANAPISTLTTAPTPPTRSNTPNLRPSDRNTSSQGAGGTSRVNHPTKEEKNEQLGRSKDSEETATGIAGGQLAAAGATLETGPSQIQQPTAAERVDTAQQIISQMVDQISQVRSTDRTETMVTLSQPPQFQGVQLIVTELDSARKELNLTFANVQSPEAQKWLAENRNIRTLNSSLNDLGFVVHQVDITHQQDVRVVSQDPNSFGQQSGQSDQDSREQRQQQGEKPRYFAQDDTPPGS